jgi:hypothetical protein
MLFPSKSVISLEEGQPIITLYSNTSLVPPSELEDLDTESEPNLSHWKEAEA